MLGLQPVTGTKLKYGHLIGTGGIGTGMFFNLEGDHTLGRNESRLGSLMPFKDYCKLHIIAHYISVLLGASCPGRFEVYPLGMVGDDEAGKKLTDEMQCAGMNIGFVRRLSDCSTLFSVCFQYPDKTGGNITTAESASSRITPEDIDAFFKMPVSCCSENPDDDTDGVYLAVPEVPVRTRVRLLETGRSRGGFTAASVLSSEVEEFRRLSGFEKTDLLAVNIDEAEAIAETFQGSPGGNSSIAGPVILKCFGALKTLNPNIMLIISDGPNGCYGCSGDKIERYPALDVEAIGTSGAGDALLAGVICGLCCGLPFLKGKSDGYFSETPLKSAMELGILLAGISVTSPDSIDKDICAEYLIDFVRNKNIGLGPEFERLFTDKV